MLSVAQESRPPSPSPSLAKTRKVQISFVPPPMEGSISLGIYDSKGKLVRVLHREAELDDFQIGSDALATMWDGKNDAGENLPSGKYHARGYLVGNLQIEGIGFFFNDWVTADGSPHIKKIENFAWNTEQSLVLLVTLADGKNTSIACDLQGQLAEKWQEPDSTGFDFYDLVSPEHRNLRVESGKLYLDILTKEKHAQWPDLVSPQDASLGRGGTVWVIDKDATDDPRTEVKQFSPGGEFLRRLTFSTDEPPPKMIRSSQNDDWLFLLEENAAMQRMRGLNFMETKTENSERLSKWKVEFEKKIVVHKNFGIENGKPVVDGGKTPPEKVSVTLRPNPLENEARVTVELCVGYDEHGSFLQTADGLPLQSIGETLHLTRVALSPHGEKSVDVFQDDDAVVEQFRISGLDQMMAFDCGAFDLN